MSGFTWSRQKGLVALALAQGETQKEAAESQNVTDRTIRRWLADTEFSAEVNRLSIMIGVANRAERLRIANRIIRQRTKGDIIETDKDLLDWLKFAQSETDGLKLELSEAAG